MTQARNTILALAIMVPLAACSDDGDATEPAEHKIEELGDSVGDLEAIVASHDTAVTAAGTLGEITAEEATYAANVEASHEELHHMVDELAVCGHEGDLLDVTDIEETLEELEAEVEAHATAMAAAADVSAATTEETRHQAAIDAIFTTLQGHQDAMAAASGEFTCDAHHDE